MLVSSNLLFLKQIEKSPGIHGVFSFEATKEATTPYPGIF
jgi:hypothetical protein